MQNFISTFILTPTPTSNHVLCEVPEILAKDAHRKRRSHSKSHSGCQSCRRRRVKCNEAVPCSNCTQRGEKCEPRYGHEASRRELRYSLTSNHRKSAPHQPRSPLEPPLLTTLADKTRMNLTSLYLFHHFQVHTQHTLLLPSPVWATATKLSFSFPFLMHAILCISARHLAYLSTERTAYYANLSSTHLHRTLSGFRSALPSAGLASKKEEDIDVFISTALLLQFELWADVSYLQHGDGDEGNYNPSKDAIFAYSASLKNTLLEYFEPSDVQRSSVMTHLANDGTLSDIVPLDPCTTAYVQNLFLQGGTTTRDLLLPPTLSPEDMSKAKDKGRQGEAVATLGDVYGPIVSALTPLLVYLSSSHLPLKNASMSYTMSTSTKIARHILCFPILCRGAFAGKIAASDPCALLILYHFFRAARILLDGDEFWWAKRRAVAVERGLGKWFGREYPEE